LLAAEGEERHFEEKKKLNGGMEVIRHKIFLLRFGEGWILGRGITHRKTDS
jgi:hypothetical protein